jgi:hypothetical protein
MIEFTDYRLNAAAPTIFVNKLGSIYRLTQSITKVTFVLAAPGRADPARRLACCGRAPTLMRPLACFAGHSTKSGAAQTGSTTAAGTSGRI